MSVFDFIIFIMLIVTFKHATGSEFIENTSSVDNHPNLALLPESCGHYDRLYTIPGRNASLYQYPWMALISYNNVKGVPFNCTGAIINPQYILTAAQCVFEKLQIVGVRIGDHNIQTKLDCEGEDDLLICEDKIQDLEVQEVITHDMYEGFPNLKNDIALIRLKEPANLTTENVGAICLPVTSKVLDTSKIGLHGYIAGWDLTNENIEPSVLHSAYIHIVNSTLCIKEEPGVIKEKFCAGGDSIDCIADFGSPFMLAHYYRDGILRNIQYGIFSEGRNNCHETRPARYTDVTKHVGWILDNIKP